MATFTAIKGRGKGSGAMGGVMQYVQQKKKTLWEGQQLVTGYNCTSRTAYLEMRMTKQQFHKTDGRQYYHFVQSFPEQDRLTPQEAHAIGLEFAQKQFPDFEVIVATHVDTDNLHNHLVVNSVSYKTGMKLHQNAADLQQHRQVNDMICQAHGLSVLPPAPKQVRQKRMSSSEYRAAARGQSWKFRLMNTIDECLYNHQDEVRDGKRVRKVPKKEWLRHEDVYPPIISREDWEQAQALLQKQIRKRVKSNTPCHRYAGLLACGDCGAPFVAINRYWNGSCRVEYICKTYMRHGKDTCTSHRIREEVLDQMVHKKLTCIHDTAIQELAEIKQLQKRRALKEPVLNAQRLKMEKRLRKLDMEIDDILMERISGI